MFLVNAASVFAQERRHKSKKKPALSGKENVVPQRT